MSNKVTLKIPQKLYRQIQDLIRDTGFNSVTEFVKFVLRDIASQGDFEGPEELGEDIQKIKKRLKKLGYFDR